MALLVFSVGNVITRAIGMFGLTCPNGDRLQAASKEETHAD